MTLCYVYAKVTIIPKCIRILGKIICFYNANTKNTPLLNELLVIRPFIFLPFHLLVPGIPLDHVVLGDPTLNEEIKEDIVEYGTI